MSGPGLSPHASPGRLSSRSRPLLFGLLVLVLAAWLVTWPIRSRMMAHTRAIEQQTAAEQAELRQRQTVQSGLEKARQAAAAKPSDLNAQLTLAEAEIRAGKLSDAFTTLQAASTLKPGDPRPYTLLGALDDRVNAPDLAVLEYRTALSKAPDSPDALAALAYKYVTFGWNQAAISLTRRGLKLHPQDPRLRTAFALASFQIGDMTGAERALLEARRLAPRDTSVLKPLVEVYRRSNRYPQALKVIDEMPAADSSSPLFLLERAEIYLQMGQLAQAIQWADAVLMQQPANPDALSTRAVAEKTLGRTADAIRDFKASLKQNPTNASTALILGQLLVRQGQSVQGRALLATAARLKAQSDRVLHLTLKVAYGSRDPSAHLQLADALLSSGDLGLAVVEYRRALELQPGSTAARQGLIRALKAAGRAPEAVRLAHGGPYHPAVTLAD